MERIGIIGAGQMGTGIAQICAVAGYDVRMIDVKDEVIAASLATIETNISRQVARGRLSVDAAEIAQQRIVTGKDYALFGDCDLVIEAASEDEEVKRDVLKSLVPHLSPDAIIATNTSSISITRLAAATDRPGKFVGMHFMNPVPVMQLVELIRAIQTEQPTFDTVRRLAESLGKTVSVAEDFPAFIVNRILMPMINEAIYTLYAGVGSVESIDTAMKLGANHPMGPLELADFIGLDTCLAIMHSLHSGLADAKYQPCPLLVKYVEAGWLGRKTKRGFYDYHSERPVPTR
ncbi:MULTISPECIES: 3-hydroxybutyryl-CoA dehydrogenase [Thalassobaculum]|uniref:3-hydroxyacyl-CoA dehydrogenase n=1 Tax=Thalassobaculum litoreum DSM 18839 TaxID=1123362 RepID=A0A8G2BHS2_9PROT|nr:MULTISPECIES: 3-hydroxybutyryl-CoA dehydrogenase [Thalassobaculum]SDF77630.1 3-hydroxyacyl-CoA dehydrogenase [Thalassobaculum litoreum DSM 18839]